MTSSIRTKQSPGAVPEAGRLSQAGKFGGIFTRAKRGSEALGARCKIPRDVDRFEMNGSP
jgi:hypothetical protein